MEGMARAVNAYSLHPLERLWLYLTLRFQNYKDKLFLSKYLDVK